MNLLGMKRKLLPYGIPLGGAGGFIGTGLGALSQATPNNSNTNSAAPAPSGGKSSGAGQGGYGGAPSFGGQQTGGMPISGTGGQLFGGQQLMQPGQQQLQPGMSFDQFKQSGMMGARTGEYRSPEQEAALDQKDYQNYLSGPQAPTYGQGQTNPMDAQRAMQGMGGKSSGLGQGGYGMAPGFGGQERSVQRPLIQPGRFNEQELNPYQPGGMPPPQQGMGGGASIHSNMNLAEQRAALSAAGGQNFNDVAAQNPYANQMGRPVYQDRPQVQQGMAGMGGFGGQQELAQERENYLQSNPAFQQMRQLQASFGGGQPPQEQQTQLENLNRQVDRDPGMRQFEQRLQQMQQGMGGMGRFGGMGGMAAQRAMQGGFGPQAPTQDAYNGFRAMTGSPASFEEFSQSRGNKFTQQPRFGGPQPLVQRFDQPRQQFNQQQFNPFQQQFGGFQQPQQRFGGFQQQPQQQSQDMRGLAELLSLLRGRG